jgi:bifunctional oligoribonuclease and PAP phosphatase NrnA
MVAGSPRRSSGPISTPRPPTVCSSPSSTDTGGFRFANATPTPSKAAAALVRAGARPEMVSQWLYESQPEAALRLLGELLPTLELAPRRAIATVRRDPEMFARAARPRATPKGWSTTRARSTASRRWRCSARSATDLWKVSLRSRGAIDVQAIARRHGGGGHKNAAGFTLRWATLAPLRAELVAELAAAR